MSTKNKTKNLKLPQYQNDDLFDMKEVNEAYKTIDCAYGDIIALDESVKNNEEERISNYSSLKNDLLSLKTLLENTDNTVASNEEERVNAEILRNTESIKLNNQLKETNTSVTNAEVLRSETFNTLKTNSENLISTMESNISNYNASEETRKTNEANRVSAEATRVTEFNKIKQDNSTLNTSLTKKVDDKIKEIQSTTDTLKENINTSFNELSNEQQNNFEALREEALRDIEASYVGYDNEQHHNLESRLNSDFDKINQRVNDSSYLEYEGTSIKADNTYYGLTKEAVIKGRTLQNLCVGEGNYHGYYDDKFNTYRGNNNKQPLSFNLKPNTTYTRIMYNCEFEGDYLRMYDSVAETDGTYKQYPYDFKTPTCVTTFTTGEKGGKNEYFFNPESGTAGKTGFSVKVGKLIILEGDYTNTPIEELPFVEGIQSVGENEVQEDGKYLISGKSCGKNLFKGLNKDNFYCDNSNYTLYENGYIREIESSWNKVVTINVGKLKPNTKYCYSVKLYNSVNMPSRYNIRYYKNDKTLVDTNTATTNGTKQTFTTPNVYFDYVVFYFRNNSLNNREGFYDLQIEENTQVTEYEPYQESTYSYLLDEPLMQLPNGVADSIYLETGVLTRRVGKIVFDGVTNRLGTVSSITNTLENVACFNCPIKNSLANFGDRAYCTFSHYEAGNGDYEHWRTSYQNVNGDTTNRIGSFYVFINRSKLSALTNEAINEWLQSNPITVYYPLKEEITEQLEPTQLKSFEGTTHIVSNNTLQAHTSVKIPSNVQAVVTNLINENKSLIKDVDVLNVENEWLKETNEVQDELIDINMMATDEVYTMIEPLLASQPTTMNLRERGVSKLVDMYVAMVQRGLKTIEQIPSRYREEVKSILETLEK